MDKTFFSLKLGERIKQLRRENNISQSELARRCNKDKQHIELIENGKISPTIYTIYLLANALEIELGKFFDSLMQSVKPGQDEDNNVYKKYMQPLVVKSLDNYAKKNEGTNKDDMLDKFNSSISHTEQSKINENIVLGIRNALQLLVDKKKEVLDLDPSRHNQINEIYRVLEKNLDGLE